MVRVMKWETRSRVLHDTKFERPHTVASGLPSFYQKKNHKRSVNQLCVGIVLRKYVNTKPKVYISCGTYPLSKEGAKGDGAASARSPSPSLRHKVSGVDRLGTALDAETP